jgi:hypothetical protein
MYNPISHLRGNTSGGVAEDALVKDGQNAAASTLADGGADLGEVVSVNGDVGGLSAVEVGNAEDVGGAALGAAVEAGARDVDLALVDLNGGGGSHGEAGKGGDESDSGEDLHVCGGGLRCWFGEERLD